MGKVFLDQLGTAPGVDQVVETDARDFQILEHLEEGGDFLGVALVDGEAQSHLEPFGLTVFNALDGFFICSGNASEAVMDFFAAVHGDAHVGQADFLEFLGFFTGDERAVGGNDGPHSFVRGVVGEFHQVLAHQGFAAGKEHDRSAVPGQIVDDGLGLGRGNFVFSFRIDGLGVTVHATQVAATGHVPDHHRLLVLGKLQQMRRQFAGFAAITQGVRGVPLNRNIISICLSCKNDSSRNVWKPSHSTKPTG